MSKEASYDYEVLHTCNYPVASNVGPYYEDDCGEPALYRVYWFDEDGKDLGEMVVCQEHFDFIVFTEKSV